MYKVLRNFFIISLFVSHLSANIFEDVWYDFFGFEHFTAGGGIGYTQINVDNDILSPGSTDVSKIFSIGTQFYGERLSFNYYDYKEAKDVDIFHFMFAFDYLFNLNSQYRPFVGVSLGQFSLKETGLQSKSSLFAEDGYEMKSLAYGVQAGWDYVEDAFRWNVRFEYVQPTHSGVTLTHNSIATKVKVQDIYGAYVSFIYNFK